jgi:multicomponent Na+:H+ antiporter subunit E
VRGRITLRRVSTVIAMTVAWCGLWGGLSVANVASGLAVSAGIVAVGVGTPAQGGVRIVPLLHLLWLVLVDLIRSTIDVAIEILTPTDRTEEGIVAVDLPAGSNQHLLLLMAAITLTPGTAVVDADSDTGRLYLHLLHVDKRHATTNHARKLAQLACEALPPSDREVSP